MPGSSESMDPATWSEAYEDALDLLERGQRTGEARALRAAVGSLRRMEATAPAAERVLAASALEVGLHSLYLVTGEPESLDEAVALGHRLVRTEGAGPYAAPLRANLANTLRIRYELHGSAQDLDQAVELCEAAARATRDPRQLAPVFNNLGLCLRLRYQAGSGAEDVESAIESGRLALRLIPDDHADRAAVLANLANSHYARFERTGAEDDLDEAVRIGRSALSAGGSAPDLVASSNLAAALQLRAERTGDRADLNEAIVLGGVVVDATSAGDPRLLGRLTNLSAAYLTRFDRSADADDLDAAIRFADRAVGRTAADDAGLSGRLSNLAAALRTKAERYGDRADLDRSVLLAQRAVDAAPPGHPALPGHRSNLGNSLRARHQHLGAEADAIAAIAAYEEAAGGLPADHPERATPLVNLGGVSYEHYARTGDRTALAGSVRAFRAAAGVETTRPRIRVSAAAAWGRTAFELGDVRGADEGLTRAVELLPSMAPRSLLDVDQEHQLSFGTSLAADAAAAALAVGDAGRAVALLELGRGILLGQALDARADLAGLAERAPGLAGRLDELWRELESPDAPGQAVDRRRRAAVELAGTIERVRTEVLPDFLRPPRVEDLCGAARDGPIVLINISELRSDAVVLQPDEIRTLSLPLATPAAVRAQVNLLGTMDGGHEPWPADRDAAVAAVLDWLWEAVTGPVLDLLGAGGGPAQKPSRLWWVPTGPLALLPLHAAGNGADGVPDRVVSSYAPTIRALIHARGRPSTPVGTVAVVGPSAVDGMPVLPAAAAEAAVVAGLVPHAQVLEGSEVTRSAVLVALRSHSWVHLACHAVSDPVHPSRSGLAVWDPDGSMLSVADLSRLRIPGGGLAYLSACSTAQVPAALPDEPLHITAAFQLAGLSHVIGTLWPVVDRPAARVAVDLYTRLAHSGVVSPDQSAAGLHATLLALRRLRPRHPSLWAAYVHVGA